MLSLEKKNMLMMETISKLASSLSVPKIQLVNGDGNTSGETTLPKVNTNNGNNTPVKSLSSGKPIPTLLPLLLLLELLSLLSMFLLVLMVPIL